MAAQSSSPRGLLDRRGVVLAGVAGLAAAALPRTGWADCVIGQDEYVQLTVTVTRFGTTTVSAWRLWPDGQFEYGQWTSTREWRGYGHGRVGADLYARLRRAVGGGSQPTPTDPAIASQPTPRHYQLAHHRPAFDRFRHGTALPADLQPLHAQLEAAMTALPRPAAGALWFQPVSGAGQIDLDLDITDCSAIGGLGPALAAGRLIIPMPSSQVARFFDYKDFANRWAFAARYQKVRYLLLGPAYS